MENIIKYLDYCLATKTCLKQRRAVCCVSGAVLACMIRSATENIKSLTWILNCGFDRVIKQNNNSGAGVIAQSHGAECKLHFYLQQRLRGHEGVNIVSISITTAQCPAAAGVAPAPVNRGDSHFHPPTLASHQPGRVATLGLGLAGLAGLGWAGWAGCCSWKYLTPIIHPRPAAPS